MAMARKAFWQLAERGYKFFGGMGVEVDGHLGPWNSQGGGVGGEMP